MWCSWKSTNLKFGQNHVFCKYLIYSTELKNAPSYKVQIWYIWHTYFSGAIWWLLFFFPPLGPNALWTATMETTGPRGSQQQTDVGQWRVHLSASRRRPAVNQGNDIDLKGWCHSWLFSFWTNPMKWPRMSDWSEATMSSRGQGFDFFAPSVVPLFPLTSPVVSSTRV